LRRHRSCASKCDGKYHQRYAHPDPSLPTVPDDLTSRSGLSLGSNGARSASGGDGPCRCPSSGRARLISSKPTVTTAFWTKRMVAFRPVEALFVALLREQPSQLTSNRVQKPDHYEDLLLELVQTTARFCARSSVTQCGPRVLEADPADSEISGPGRGFGAATQRGSRHGCVRPRGTQSSSVRNTDTLGPAGPGGRARRGASVGQHSE
jgi:hypothetical protein